MSHTPSALEEHILSGLNPQQYEAVKHHGTPLLIIAGAGSGKTRVITHRIAYLSHVVGIPLWQILAVTFTNKAAKEMRERICRILETPNVPTLPIGTFHSRCAMLLRREADAAKLDRSFAILDERDQVSAVKKAMEACKITEKHVKPAQVQHFINMAKMRLLTPGECREELDHGEIPYADIYSEYERILEKNNSLDFEDLIFKSVHLLRDNDEARRRWNEKYRYILVDEFQDTNHSQFELVKLLVGEDRQISVVGDEDQSIYSWRGADVTNLLDFQKVYPDCKLVRLEQNYRSVGNVLKAADGVISHNTMRIGKHLWTEKEDGDLLHVIKGLDEADEAEQVAFQIGSMLRDGISADQIAVFYRSHRLSRAVEDGMRKFRIPYRILGATRFYDRAEVKDLLSYLRLAVQPHNDLAFERVVNVPARGVGKKTLSDVVHRSAFHQESLFQATAALLNEGDIKGKARTALGDFLEHVQTWHRLANDGATCSAVLERILKDTQYVEEHLGDPNSLDARVRIENIEELKNVVVQYEQEVSSQHGVVDFLEAMSLDAQREEEDDRPKVSLMTIHNSKGLEFDYVFIVGLEHGLFPSSRTMDSPAEYEEERRLFYVALTRARRRITLSRAERRLLNGHYEYTVPSPFLREVPQELFTPADLLKLGIAMADRRGAPAGTYRATNAEIANRGRTYQNRAFGQSIAADISPKKKLPANQGPLLSPRAQPPKTIERSGPKSFAVGDRVEHAILGPGKVTSARGSFGAERVHVEFDDGRSQEFLVKFAPLTKLAE